jgi:hypothetical protein
MQCREGMLSIGSLIGGRIKILNRYALEGLDIRGDPAIYMNSKLHQ